MPNSIPPDIWRAIAESVYGILLAFVGGLVVALNKLAAGEYTSKWGILADLLSSGFAGVLVYSLCRHFEAPFWLSAFLTGVAGHGGVRTLHWLQVQVANRFGAKQ
ncbi:MAG TPA: phage holin family protein [Burkholderiaceae bacterium]|nr:phage holin family protein [Burkholderiaceae bacterium]